MKACKAAEGAGGSNVLKEKLEAVRARRAWVLEAMALKRVARMRSSAGTACLFSLFGCLRLPAFSFFASLPTMQLYCRAACLVCEQQVKMQFRLHGSEHKQVQVSQVQRFVCFCAVLCTTNQCMSVMQGPQQLEGGWNQNFRRTGINSAASQSSSPPSTPDSAACTSSIDLFAHNLCTDMHMLTSEAGDQGVGRARGAGGLPPPPRPTAPAPAPCPLPSLNRRHPHKQHTPSAQPY